MKVIVLVGIPGAGKSSFFRERFGHTYVHVSKDLMLPGHVARGRIRHPCDAASALSPTEGVEKPTPGLVKV